MSLAMLNTASPSELGSRADATINTAGNGRGQADVSTHI
jgi:hypothetical protein